MENPTQNGDLFSGQKFFAAIRVIGFSGSIKSFLNGYTEKVPLMDLTSQLKKENY